MSNDDLHDKTMIITPTVKHDVPFAAVLTCVGPPPKGAVAEIALNRELTVGRGADHDVVLEADGVSRNHARFVPGNGTWGVQDLGSTNGVLVNETKVEQETWLSPGDIVSLGSVHYEFKLAGDGSAAGGSVEQPATQTERTLIIRPGETPTLAGESEPSTVDTRSEMDLSPGRRGQVGQATAVRTPAAPRSARTASAAPARSGSSAGLWVAVAAVVAVAVVAFFALG